MPVLRNKYPEKTPDHWLAPHKIEGGHDKGNSAGNLFVRGDSAKRRIRPPRMVTVEKVTCLQKPYSA